MLNKKNGTLCAIILQVSVLFMTQGTSQDMCLAPYTDKNAEGPTVFFQAPMQPISHVAADVTTRGDAGAGPADMLARDGSEAAAASSSASSSMLPTFPSKVCIVRCIVSSLLGSCVQPTCSSVGALGSSVLHR